MMETPKNLFDALAFEIHIGVFFVSTLHLLREFKI